MDAAPTELSTGWIACWGQFNRKIRKRLSERYADAGLTESRASVLEFLDGADRHLTQTELADLLVISESNLCGVIEKMCQEGLIIRGRSPLDRRKSVLSLTEAGVLHSVRVRMIHEQLEDDVRQELKELDPVVDLAPIRSVLASLAAQTTRTERHAK